MTKVASTKVVSQPTTYTLTEPLAWVERNEK